MEENYGKYTPETIEKKWQRHWLENEVFKAEDFSKKPKLYVLDMFPYPSGSGLHVGHPEGYTATDIFSRYKRMCGYNVLHPMGWDAFGLPAEQYAIETGTHPKITTEKNIANFRRQIQSLGFSYDWSREINTTDPKYYRWTQWIFIQLFKKGLAYVDHVPVNWCHALGTVLANEEVIQGKSERGGHPVVRVSMKQWMLRITKYAERLLDDLDELDWPEGIKEMQRNWIGKSHGAEVLFPVFGSEETIKVFTTRPDTLFGATYMVLAPEHPLVKNITTHSRKEEVVRYQEACSQKSDIEREINNEKTGVFTGGMAINPVNKETIPIWISDYVMMGYGTGAIMAVPAHDNRDFAFATVFSLPIKPVLLPDPSEADKEDVAIEDVLQGKACWTGLGVVINSVNREGLDINSMDSNAAKQKIITWLEKQKLGKSVIHYRLRDWLFSRQRYWGEPFPVIHMDDGEIRLLDPDQLPVILPELEDFKPTGTGESPLAKDDNWSIYVDPNTGKKGRRETHTMPQWAGSCWYYLRYLDPNNEKEAWDKKKEKYWMPVDLYVGGAEHAVLHLLYARFWHKALYDLGHVSTKEPFQRLVNQGMILGISYKESSGKIVQQEDVIENNGKSYHQQTKEELTPFPAKMSKSLKNVVNPDDIVAEYGADSFRLYEMFMGPIEAAKPWNTKGVEGVHRFLQRVWRMVVGSGQTYSERENTSLTRKQKRLLHKTIKKVTDDLEELHYNTAISQLMVFVNEFHKDTHNNKRALEIFVKLLSPMAPHIAEELWEYLGHSQTITYESWPHYEEKYIREENVEILVQIKGKPKIRLMMSTDLSVSEVEKTVLRNEQVRVLIRGHDIKKIICVPGRLVNIVF